MIMELNELKFDGSNRLRELAAIRRNLINDKYDYSDIFDLILSYAIRMGSISRDELMEIVIDLECISIEEAMKIIDWCDEVRQELL